MKTLGFLAISLLLAAPLAAQQTSPDTVRLADRSVTATKVSASRGVAPAVTTVITGEEMRSRGITFVTDALREVPGLTVVPNGSYGSITSVYLRGGESDYIKVLLDGVVLNQPGGSIYLSDLTTDNLDRIEIVRGPVSVLYGADAVSGVIQLFTKEGRKHPGGALSVWRGTFHNSLYDLGLAGKTGPYSISLAGSDFKSDGTYPFNNKYRNRVGSLLIDHLAPNGRRIGLSGRYGDATANYPTDYTGIAVDSNQFNRSKSLALGLNAMSPLKGSTLLSLQGYYSRFNSDYENRPDSPGDSLDYGYDADRGSITSRKGGDVRVDWSLASSGSVLSLGAGYEKEKEQQTSRTVSNFGTGAFEETGDFFAERSTKQLYAQGFLVAGPRVTLQLGARLDDNSAFGNFFTWRGGLAFNRGNVRLWASAGTAYKAPTFSELFALGSFEVGNPDLNPERSRNFEGGITLKRPSSRLVLGLSAFRQRFRDLIQYVGAAPGVSNYVNLGGADSRGIEATVSVRTSDAVNIRAHWTWLTTEVTDSGSASSVTFTQGERLLRRPGSSGGVTVTLQAAGATVVGVVNFIGERDDADYRNFPTARTTLPRYRTVDLSITKPVSRGSDGAGWDLMLRGENIFDTEYEQVVAFPGRGRTLFIGARSHY